MLLRPLVRVTLAADHRATDGFGGSRFLALAPGEDLRDAYELDALDFLALAETLSAGRGARIDKEDYPEPVSVDSCVRFLTRS